MHSGPSAPVAALPALPARRLLQCGMAMLLAGAWCVAPATEVAADGPLHVPSPDWRDQVLYFLMIDRFANELRPTL